MIALIPGESGISKSLPSIESSSEPSFEELALKNEQSPTLILEVGDRHEQTLEGRQAFQARERNLAAFCPGINRPIMAIAPDDKRDGVSGVGLDEPLDVELAPLVANLDRVDELGQNHFVGAIGA